MINLQYISQGNTPELHLKNIREALKAGCKWIQLRIKDAKYDEYLEIAKITAEMCRQKHATFIVNDNVSIALQSNAHGLHVGMSDMPPLEARRILGKDAIIGGTANTFKDIQYMASQKVDYIGLGPYQFTDTKSNLSPVLGVNGYQRILEQMKCRDIKIPVYAIGGIKEQDIPSLIKAGIKGIAASSLITHSNEKTALFQRIDNYFKTIERQVSY